MLKTTVGKNNLTVRQILTDPILLLAFGFGSGLSNKAPGTVGTLIAVPIYLLLEKTGIVIYSLSSLLICLGGIGICEIAAEKLGEHDFSGIVWDEIAGYLVALWIVPFSWQAVVLGFILFRAFDILKPWPIKWIDSHVHGGLGIMLDDILAGAFCSVILVLSV